MTRRPAGGPVPILNYSPSLIVEDGCRFVSGDRAWYHTPTVHWMDGIPAAWFTSPDHAFQAGAFGQPYTYEGNRPMDEQYYHDLCAVHYAVASAATFFRFITHFHPRQDYIGVVVEEFNRLSSRMYDAGIRSGPVGVHPQEAPYEPYVFSRSASDPLFAVIGVAPGQQWLYYDTVKAAFVVPIFLLTLDPSNFCVIQPDMNGAPGMICGFDPDNPPMVLMYLTASGFSFTPSAPSYPLGASVQAPYWVVLSGYRFLSPLHDNLSFGTFNRRQILESAYPHYYLAREMRPEDARKFIRSHVGSRFVDSYLPALLALRSRAAAKVERGDPARLQAMTAERAWRVLDPSHNLALTPYISGVVQRVDAVAGPTNALRIPDLYELELKVTATVKLTRAVGADYFVVSGSTNGFVLNDPQGKNVISRTYVVDFANNAAYRVDSAGNCVAIRHSTLDPQLSRPDFIADFRHFQVPRLLHPRQYTNLPPELSYKWDGKDAVDVRVYERLDWLGRVNPPFVRGYDLRATVDKGVVKLNSKGPGGIYEEPFEISYNLQSKPDLSAESRLVSACREQLSRTVVPMRELVDGVLASGNNRVQFDTMSPVGGTLYFIGTRDEWSAALRAEYAKNPLEFAYRAKDGKDVRVKHAEEGFVFDEKGARRPLQVFIVFRG